MYRKPVGNDEFVEGLSIRFAETAIQAMRNISVTSNVVHEDEGVRTVSIAVTDLETNLSYSKDVAIAKVVERKFPRKGQVVLAERETSGGGRVFLVVASEDELANRLAAAESKVIRNFGLRLVPSDILEDAARQIEKTMSSGASDPAELGKKLMDSFLAVGVTVDQLQQYLGHPMSSLTTKEAVALRKVYIAVRDGEASFQDYLSGKQQPDPQATQKPSQPAATQAEAASPPAQNGAAATSAAPPAAPSQKAGAKAAAEELHSLVSGAHFTFDAYLRAAIFTKLAPPSASDAWQSYDDVPEAVIKRHIRAFATIKAAMRQDAGMSPEDGVVAQPAKASTSIQQSLV